MIYVVSERFFCSEWWGYSMTDSGVPVAHFTDKHEAEQYIRENSPLFYREHKYFLTGMRINVSAKDMALLVPFKDILDEEDDWDESYNYSIRNFKMSNFSDYDLNFLIDVVNISPYFITELP